MIVPIWNSTQREGSFVELPSEKVRSLATECLQRVEAHRAKLKKAEVEALKQTIEKSWVQRFGRRWLGWTFPSDEKIVKKVEENAQEVGDHFDLSLWLIQGWKSKEAAKKLLLACEHADKVMVSLEDLDLIT